MYVYMYIFYTYSPKLGTPSYRLLRQTYLNPEKGMQSHLHVHEGA